MLQVRLPGELGSLLGANYKDDLSQGHIAMSIRGKYRPDEEFATAETEQSAVPAPVLVDDVGVA